MTFAEDYDTSVTAAKFGEPLQRTVYLHTDMLTADLTVTFDLPTSSDECLLTVRNVHVSSVGANYACHQDLQGAISATQPFSTTQSDPLALELGIVSNLGTCTTILSHVQFKRLA